MEIGAFHENDLRLFQSARIQITLLQYEQVNFAIIERKKYGLKWTDILLFKK